MARFKRALTYNEQIAQSAAAQGTMEGSGMRAVSGAYGYNDPRVQPGSFSARLAEQNQAQAAGGGLGQEYQTAQEKADAANAQQDKELREGFAGRFRRNVDRVETMGQAALGDTNRIYDEREGMIRAELAKAGLLAGGGSAVTGALEGNARERADALARTRDTIASRQIAVDSALAKDQLDQIERVQHIGPDMNQLIGLESQVGSGNTAGMMVPQQPQMPVAYSDGTNGFGTPLVQARLRGGRTPEEAAANRARAYATMRTRRAMAQPLPSTVGEWPSPAPMMANLPPVAMPTIKPTLKPQRRNLTASLARN